MNNNPYSQALKWIEENPGCGSTIGLGKLILSLWNPDMAYSLRECTQALDEDLRNLALKIISYFLQNGEDRDLYAAGERVYALYPLLWAQGIAGYHAKRDFIKSREEKADRNKS
jgi:hypothetical protein